VLGSLGFCSVGWQQKFPELKWSGEIYGMFAYLCCFTLYHWVESRGLNLYPYTRFIPRWANPFAVMEQNTQF
jgi:hypothetical protein